MSAYISEFQYYGQSNEEFVEVALPAGTDPSGYSVYFYDFEGNVLYSFPLGSSTGTMGGSDVYVIDANTPGFDDGGADSTGRMYPDDALALVDGDGNVVQFISYWDNTVTATQGPAAGMTSTDVGTAGVGESLQSDDGGNTYYMQSSPNSGTIPACYAPGSLIATPAGPRRVETLKPGDTVLGPDGAAQVIRWVWSGDQPLDDVDDSQKPVLIAKGALGPNRPAQDLIVSGQHRIVVGAHDQLADLFPTACMVPAKALTTLPGIRFMAGKRDITWHHIVCDAHSTVLANGVVSETMLLGPVVLAGMARTQLRALSMALGRLITPLSNDPICMTCLTVGETQRILSRANLGARRDAFRAGKAA